MPLQPSWVILSFGGAKTLCPNLACLSHKNKVWSQPRSPKTPSLATSLCKRSWRSQWTIGSTEPSSPSPTPTTEGQAHPRREAIPLHKGKHQGITLSCQSPPLKSSGRQIGGLSEVALPGVEGAPEGNRTPNEFSRPRPRNPKETRTPLPPIQWAH